MLLVQLASINAFIPCDNWNIMFFVKMYRYPQVFFNRHVLTFFETSDLEEDRILFFILTILIPKLKYYAKQSRQKSQNKRRRKTSLFKKQVKNTDLYDINP